MIIESRSQKNQCMMRRGIKLKTTQSTILIYEYRYKFNSDYSESFSLIIFYYVVATTNFSVREKWEDKKLAGPMKNFFVFFHLFLYNMRKSAI